MRRRRVLVAIAAVNAILIATLAFTVMRARAAEWNGTLLDPPMAEQPFELVSANGPVSSSDLHGRWTVLFFGYTRCPDACPLTLDKLRRVHAALGDDAREVQVALVTVDPGHDSPDVLAEYVARFHPSFLGLTADAATIEALAKTYGIYRAEQDRDGTSHNAHADHGHAETPQDDGAHSDDAHDMPAAAMEPPPTASRRIDHTTHVLVLDREGGLAMLWGPELTAEQMTSDLRRLLRR